MKTIKLIALSNVTGGSKKSDRIDQLNKTFGPEELPGFGEDAWKFYTGKKSA